MEKNRYGHILTENFQEAVGAWIKNYSNNIAIIEGERKITYRELGNLIIRCRKFFFEQGVKKGDNIAVHMGNHSEFIMVFLSLVTMGAVPILILSAQKKNEVRGIVRVATPKLYIYDAAVSVLGSLVAEGNKELKGIEKTIFTSMLESSEVEKTKEETRDCEVKFALFPLCRGGCLSILSVERIFWKQGHDLCNTASRKRK